MRNVFSMWEKPCERRQKCRIVQRKPNDLFWFVAFPSLKRKKERKKVKEGKKERKEGRKKEGKKERREEEQNSKWNSEIW